ncbi:Predicted ATP-grasp enzyme [Serratia quinivorans]|uniref:ATP-grasp domain-containing protein n=1 Tax=Serratia quinivorans TaxID=137545 RepID=UPI00217AA67F|nr:ATP-grasp domain-containing protein [Serratia quinivorans]CAI1723151.1 Predicted ATP-grasp enzyme [Serratia quinivorans]
MNTDKWAVVIDGYSGGHFLQTLLLEHGIKCLHIRSQEGKNSFDFLPPGYAGYLECVDNDVTALLEQLPRHCPQVDYVLHGCEQGVVLSEALSSALGLPGNPTATTAYRRNKWAMQNALAQAGVASIKQQLVDTPAALEDLPFHYPVIIKPLGDGSSINVFYCEDQAGAQALIARTLHQRNSMGEEIRQLIVQECLQGSEYIVNSVSYQGEHQVTDAWRYQKRYISNGGIVATQVRLIDPRSIPGVVDYTRQALTALQITHGAAHSEVMTDERHTTLIESGARLMGGDISRAIWRELLTDVPAEALVNCYCAPERLPQMMFQVKQFFCIVLIPVLTAGRITHLQNESWLRERLPTLYDYQPLVNEGEDVGVTRDDVGPYIGVARLMSPSNAALDRDLAWLEAYESTLFTLTPTSSGR